MSLLSEITTKQSQQPGPCPTCGSCFRWLDPNGTARCKHCSPPPSRLFVRRIETLIDWPDRPGWESVWEPPPPSDDLPPYHDPWHDGKAPDGWMLTSSSRVAYEPCTHPERVSIPCRNGAWSRIECKRCRRVLDLVDREWVEF